VASERDRTGLIPIESELRERLAWFIRLRWVAGLGVLAAVRGLVEWFNLPVPAPPLYGVGVGVLVYNAIFHVFGRRWARGAPPLQVWRMFAHLQIGMDWMALTLLVLRSGGVRSPVAFAFIFHIIIAADLLPRRACYAHTGVGAALVAGVAAMECAGVGRPFLIVWYPAGEMQAVAHALFLIGTFGAAAFLGTSITNEVRRREKELTDSERALDRAYREIKALHENNLWFARTTTHQLRSPLAALQGLLDALFYAGPVSEKQRDLLNRGRRRVEGLLDTIRDLLDLASAQRPPRAEEAESVVLLECLAGVLDTVRDRANGKGVRLDVEAVGDRAMVCAQSEDLRRIFSNLLDNGVKYTPSGGRVTFRVEGGGDCARVEVVDTGIGISEADRGRVFDGFYRTEAAKATGEAGTGLGLSIVKQLVERWGGKIELESSPGLGSRFIVTLPAGAGRGSTCTRSG
jgi:signal transduction histidine kinase